MKYNQDYSSRFRILKGGRISLVVSALLVSSSLLATEINTTVTTMQTSTEIPDYLLHVTDSGSIAITDGISNAVYIDGNNTHGFTMTNAGTIEANSDAAVNLVSIADTLDINNNNIISANGVGHNAYAINIDDSDANVTISNSGTIEATSSNYAVGVSVYDSNNTMNNLHISNSGIINVAGDTDDAAGISINNVNLNNMSIENTLGGNIIVKSNSGYAIGITFNDANMTDSSIINAGSITVEGQAAIGINAYNVYGSSNINNSGTIQATSSGNLGADGIYVNTIAGDSKIRNSGTISVSSNDAEAAGIRINDLDGSAEVINSGTIRVDSKNSSAMGIYAVGYNDNNITNSGTITATVNGQADFNGFALHTSGVTVTNSGTLNGNLNMANSTLNNSGIVNLPYSANGANAAVVGSFNQSAAGKLEINVMGNSLYSQLQTTNAAFADGSEIDVSIVGTRLLAGQTMTIVSASSLLDVNATTLNVTGGSALLKFEAVNSTNALDINIVRSKTILQATLEGGEYTSRSAAAALDTISDGNYPAMDGFIGRLNTLATTREVAQAVKSSTPVVTNATKLANTQIMDSTKEIIGLRQKNSVRSGLNAGDQVFGDQNLWIKPFGSVGKQDNKDGLDGFDLHAGGVALGYDAEYDTDQRLGLAFIYTDASLDVNNMSQTNKMKVYNLLVYGNVPVIDEKTDLLYQVGYAWQNNSTDRYLAVMDETATADFTSKTASVDLTLMQNYNLGNGFDVHPKIEATYRNYTMPSYGESGSEANLKVDDFTSTQFILGAGGIIDYALGRTSQLMIDASIGYDFYHNKDGVYAEYAGASGVQFTTDSIDNGGMLYNVGAGYAMTIFDNSELSFMYNYQGQGTSFYNHTLSAKYIWKF